MRKEKDQLILSRDDHELILGHIRNGLSLSTFSKQEADGLVAELKKAKLVDKAELPDDIVCLNASVLVKDEETGKVMELTLVTPEKADIKQRKISVLSPIAAALIGFRKGKKIRWRVPAGLKTFTIVDVRKPLVAMPSI